MLPRRLPAAPVRQATVRHAERVAVRGRRAGRSMGCCAIGLSVYAALFSGISMLGNPGYVYTHGPIVFVQCLSNYIAVPITAYLFIPFFNGLRLTSAYEYLELRFSLRVRLIGSFLFVVRIYLYLGQALYAPALALEAVAGVPILLTVLVTGGISAGYTYHGGMRTVIWTDIMQFLVLWGGQAVLTLFAWRGVEGDPIAIARAHDRFTFVDWDLDITSDYSTFNVVLGSIPLFLVQSATDQIAVQRYLTAASVREAQKGLWLKLLVLPFFNPLAYVCGVALFAYYHSGGRADPVAAGVVKNADEIMPFFAVSEMPAGLSGMLISGILAATMSTTSSGLASASTAIVTDFVLRLRWAGDSGDGVESRLALSRRVMVASSVLMVLSAWFVSQLGTQLAELAWVVNGLCGGEPTRPTSAACCSTQIAFTAPRMRRATAGPLLGVFLLGMLTRTAEERGAFCGVVAGSCALLVLMASSRFCAETGSECLAGLTWLGRIAFFWCLLSTQQVSS